MEQTDRARRIDGSFGVGSATAENDPDMAHGRPTLHRPRSALALGAGVAVAVVLVVVSSKLPDNTFPDAQQFGTEDVEYQHSRN